MEAAVQSQVVQSWQDLFTPHELTFAISLHRLGHCAQMPAILAIVKSNLWRVSILERNATCPSDSYLIASISYTGLDGLEAEGSPVD